MLGPEHQLTLPELVGACRCYLFLYLLKSLLMGLRATPGEETGTQNKKGEPIGLGVRIVGEGRAEGGDLRALGLCGMRGRQVLDEASPLDGAVVLVDEVPGLTQQLFRGW